MLLSRVFPELWKFGTHERAERRTPLMLQVTSDGNAGAVRYTTFRLQGATAGYQVTAGRTLILTRTLFTISVAATRFSVGYSDSDRGLDNAADGANPVDLDYSGTNGAGPLIALTANVMYDVPVYYEVPAGKFARVIVPVGAASFRILVFGHEV